MSHLCAIPDCERPAKDGQLMCWPHWRRVPKHLNRAIFDTCGSDVHEEEYEAVVAEAVRVIQFKESGMEYDL
jgi:hypothetical protein